MLGELIEPLFYLRSRRTHALTSCFAGAEQEVDFEASGSGGEACGSPGSPVAIDFLNNAGAQEDAWKPRLSVLSTLKLQNRADAVSLLNTSDLCPGGFFKGGGS